MIIKTATFLQSNTEVNKCPQPNLPELAFIGRSNVGKSSLINMLTNHSGLAKTSSKPGKTQLINHFLINEDWYLVDLPGYGYAAVSKTSRAKWAKFINKYLLQRENLVNVFVLIDVRIPFQKIDQEFLQFLGEKKIPFSLVFTKTDKLSKNQLKKSFDSLKKEILQYWAALPPHFLVSSVTGEGKEELLGYMHYCNSMFKPNS